MDYIFDINQFNKCQRDYDNEFPIDDANFCDEDHRLNDNWDFDN